MYLKNDLDLEIVYRKDPVFFHQKCFLDHTGILSEKKIEKKHFPKSGRDPMNRPEYYSDVSQNI